MEQEKSESQARSGGPYVWDAEKLAWVEVKQLPQEEATAEPVKPEQVEEATLDDTAVGDSGAEDVSESEEIEYKGAWIRVVGAFIDLILLTILGIIMRIALSSVVSYSSYVALIYGLVYFAGFWWWRGQTPGLMIIRAKVVRTDGGRIGAGRALLRYLFYPMPTFGPILFFVRAVSIWPIYILPLITIIFMAFSRRKRGLQDLLSGTCVIKTRGRVAQVEDVEEEVEVTEAEQSDTSELDTQEKS